MICNDCRNAATISSMTVDELRRNYETMEFLGRVNGTFEEYVDETDSRANFLHKQCKGATHCCCQHRTESIVRDLT